MPVLCQVCNLPHSFGGGGGGAWRAQRDAKLEPRLAGGIALPGGPGRHARSRGGIDCPAAFIHDAVGRY